MLTLNFGACVGEKRPSWESTCVREAITTK